MLYEVITLNVQSQPGRVRGLAGLESPMVGRDAELEALLKASHAVGAGLGREKIFEVRRVHNDLTFVDEFLTFDFCKRHNLFSFGYNVITSYSIHYTKLYDAVWLLHTRLLCYR